VVLGEKLQNQFFCYLIMLEQLIVGIRNSSMQERLWLSLIRCYAQSTGGM